MSECPYEPCINGRHCLHWAGFDEDGTRTLYFCCWCDAEEWREW